MLQASSEGKMMIEKKRETTRHYICFVWKDLETGWRFGTNTSFQVELFSLGLQQCKCKLYGFNEKQLEQKWLTVPSEEFRCHISSIQLTRLPSLKRRHPVICWRSYWRSLFEDRLHLNHCSHVGPHLGTLVPMGTKMSFLVPIWSQFIFKVPIFSISDLRTRQKSVQPLSNVNHEITCGNKN